MTTRLAPKVGLGGKSLWAPEPIWPWHEFQLAQITKDDGTEKLGFRIVTSSDVGKSIYNVFNDNKVPCSLDDSDPDIGKEDIVYLYLDAGFYQRAKYLITNKIKQKITPLPPELAELLELAKQPPSKPKQDKKDVLTTGKTEAKKTNLPLAQDMKTDATKQDKKETPTTGKNQVKKTNLPLAQDMKTDDKKDVLTTGKTEAKKTNLPLSQDKKTITDDKKAQVKNDNKQSVKVQIKSDIKNSVKQPNQTLPKVSDSTDLKDEKKLLCPEEISVEMKSPSENVPDALWCKLKDYQRLGVLKFVKLAGRMYLADDPGLGKTLQAIVCASMFKHRWPVLVVCPSSVKSNWRNEFCRWLLGTGLVRDDVRIIESEADALRVLPNPTDADTAAANTAMSKIRAASGGSIKRKRKAPSKKPNKPAKENPLAPEGDAVKKEAAKVRAKIRKEALTKHLLTLPKPVHQVYIISYDLMIRPKVYARVSAKQFKVVISDESHFLRNSNAQRTISFMGLAHRAPHVLELSGTPGFCPEQIFSQIRALQPHLFPTYWIMPPPHINTQEKWRAAEPDLPCTFAGRWGDPRPEPTFAGKFTWAVNGGARLGELNAILKEFCLLKRTKDEVLKELPEKVRHPIHFEVPLAERQIIEQEMSLMKGLRQSQPQKYKQKFMAMFNDLPRIKMPAVKEYLTTMFSPGGEMGIDPKRKVLIFAHHKAMILAIEEIVKANHVGYIKITGDTPTVKRQTLVDEFQADPMVRVAILSITAAGFGLNLQAASLVIFAELLFSESSICQAEDRSHRLGQTAPVVTCRYLIAKGTLDEGLIRMLGRKTMSSALMIEGRRNTFAMKRAERLALVTDDPEEQIITDEQIEEDAWEELVENEAQLVEVVEGFLDQK